MKRAIMVLSVTVCAAFHAGIATAQSGHVCAYTNDDAGSFNTVDGYVVTSTSQTYLSPTLTGGASANTAEVLPNIVLHPSKNILYASNSTNGTIAAMKIDPATCQLTLSGDFQGTGESKFGLGITISPDGKWMFATNTSVKELYVLGILADGSLTGKLQTVGLHKLPSGAVVSPNGATLIVDEIVNQEILSFSINDTTGKLTKVSDIPMLSGSSAMAIDARSKYVYLGEVSSTGYEDVDVLELNLGSTLTNVANYTFTEGYGASGMLLSPHGKYLYVTNDQTATITTLSVNPSDGSLAYVSVSNDGPASNPPSGLADSRKGSFLFTVSRGQQPTMGILAAGKNGSLTSLGTFPVATTGAAPIWVVARTY